MMVQFIFMTIAFVIMLIVALIQQNTNKRLRNQLEEIEVKGWREAHEGQWLCEGYDGKWTVTDEPPE